MGLRIVVRDSMETVDIAIGQAEDAIRFWFDAVTIGMIRWDGIGWGGHGDRTEGDAALGKVAPAVVAMVAGALVMSWARWMGILRGVVTVAVVPAAVCQFPFVAEPTMFDLANCHHCSHQ
jgi:hypothetical protein